MEGFVMGKEGGLDHSYCEAEEEAIREALEEILVAYGNYDGKAMSELSHDPFIMYEGVFEGRSSIDSLWENLLRMWKTQKVVPLEDLGVHFLTPDVAIWRGSSEFVDRLDAEGQPLPPQQVVGATVFVKTEGKWRRACAFVKPMAESG